MVTKLIDWLYCLAWNFVIFVSTVDAYLLFQYRESIAQLERNPLGNLLLEFGGGRVELFLCLKLLGTVVACTLLLSIYQVSRRVGLILVLSTAAAQLALLLYLNFA